ncbi:MAG: hypothetical protein HFG00_04340 [Oscillibacter sp.]|nr:hypothetical protein [Oscillibacter sp.]
MGEAKKTASSKVWTLAGEACVPTALSPGEEQVFQDSAANILKPVGEDRAAFSPKAFSKAAEQAARAAAGFFFQHFDGKYTRTDVAGALGAAAAFSAPVNRHRLDSMSYPLGAALWMLDYAAQSGQEAACAALLPPAGDPGAPLPAGEDFFHPQERILALTAVFRNRDRESRETFQRLWDLVDPETAAALRTQFKEVLLDFAGRFLEVSTRVKPPAAEPPRPNPSFSVSPLEWDLPEEDVRSPAKEYPALWFLMQSTLLVGQPQEEIRKTLYYRRSSDLMEGFRIQSEPCALCAAYLLLEREGDLLARLNLFTAAALTCAERHLPWGGGEVSAPPAVSQEGEPDYRLCCALRPPEEEGSFLPCAGEKAGTLLSENQLFYLATGRFPPRNQVPSSRLAAWLEQQGLPPERAQALTWSAWSLSLKPSSSQLPPPSIIPADIPAETPPEVPPPEKNGETAAQDPAQARQIKELRLALYEAERQARLLQEQLQNVQEESRQDRAELSRLREALFTLKAQEGQPEDETETEISFPWPVKRRIVVFGGHETWRKAIRPMLPGVRFIDREMLPDLNTVKTADAVWIQSNALSHKFYYRVIDVVRKEGVPVRYFTTASARKCAEQLVLDELSAEE